MEIEVHLKGLLGATFCEGEMREKILNKDGTALDSMIMGMDSLGSLLCDFEITRVDEENDVIICAVGGPNDSVTDIDDLKIVPICPHCLSERGESPSSA